VGRTEHAEVAGLAVEVNDIGEVDGVADKTSGVHEVVGNFVTGEEGDLSGRVVTMMGPMRLRLPVKLLEKMIKM